MGIGGSILLIAVGAILKFAVSASISGVSLGTVGVILMIVGAIGLVASMIIWGPRRRSYRRSVEPLPGNTAGTVAPGAGGVGYEERVDQRY